MVITACEEGVVGSVCGWHPVEWEVDDPIQNNWIYLTANYLLFIPPGVLQRLILLFFCTAALTSQPAMSPAPFHCILIDCVITIIFNTYQHLLN